MKKTILALSIITLYGISSRSADIATEQLNLRNRFLPGVTYQGPAPTQTVSAQALDDTSSNPESISIPLIDDIVGQPTNNINSLEPNEDNTEATSPDVEAQVRETIVRVLQQVISDLQATEIDRSLQEPADIEDDNNVDDNINDPAPTEEPNSQDDNSTSEDEDSDSETDTDNSDEIDNEESTVEAQTISMKVKRQRK